MDWEKELKKGRQVRVEQRGEMNREKEVENEASPIPLRKLTSTTWTKDPSGAEELHRRYWTITDTSPPPDPCPLSSLSLSMCFPHFPYTAEIVGTGANSLTELISNPHRARTARMRSWRLGLLWVKEDGEENGARLNWSFKSAASIGVGGGGVAHLGTSDLRDSVSAPSRGFYCEHFKPVLWRLSALIGCRVLHWFYNMG
ncbi:hypothetical protein Q8A73_000654 [Channa argus]|nr:hypothetical protein Q8A73_000654 [Channa argus]